MRLPDCPEHDRLVLDLALGRLSDQDAVHAESARRECPHCTTWWRTHLEREALTVVDREVAAALASFQPPRRTHRRLWLAAAAAVVLAVALALVWNGTTGPATHPQVVDALQPHPTPDTAQALFGDGLESGDLTGWKVVDGPPARSLFIDGMESGDLSGWSS